MKRNSNSIGPEVRKGLTEEEINSPEFNADDFAPAPDAGVTVGINEEKKNKKNAVAFALVAAVLALMIGLLGWGISAGIDDYYENITKNEVLSVFPNCNKIEKLEINNRDFEVYVVFFKERIAGYCVLGTAEGFGGPIRFAVAFNSEDHISKVSVLEHNESKGLGAKIAGEKFLSAFVGLIAGDDEFKLAKKDLIAGATTSYTAMEESIQKVLALGITTESIAVELGFETITEEEIEEEVRKEEEEKENNKSDEDDDEKNPSKDNDSNSEPVDTDGNGKPGVGDNVGGTNVNIGDEETDDDLNGKDEDTVYDSETEETEEPEETTGEPEDSKEPDETTGKP
ncbi:MAG: FMN-binding protein, partial [Clostridia bacterium]|nr:FMN-binding protein [Clostridia bacterium]